MGINPYARYQKVQVETADQGKLLLMLYAGALRFLGLAKKALRSGNLESTNHNLLRVQDIITELTAALDLEAGEVAEGLLQLYDYISHLLVQGNIKKEVQLLERAEALLKELQDSWQEVLGEKQPVGQGDRDGHGLPAAGGDDVEDPVKIKSRVNISG